MTTLKDLLEQRQSIDDQLMLAYGEIDEKMSDELTKLEVSLPEKVDKYMGLIDKLDIDYEYFEVKLLKYQKVVDGIKKLKERLRENIKAQMIEKEMMELHGNEEKYSLSNGKAKVVITSTAKIPRKYIHTQIIETAKKEDLRLALEAGEIIEGVGLEKTLVLKRGIKK